MFGVSAPPHDRLLATGARAKSCWVGPAPDVPVLDLETNSIERTIMRVTLVHR